MSVIQIDLSENTPVQARGDFPVVPAGRYVMEITGFAPHVASTGSEGFLVKGNVLWAEEIQTGGDPDAQVGVGLIDGFYGKMILPALVNALQAIGNTESEAKAAINEGFDAEELFVGQQVVWDVTLGVISKGARAGKQRNNVSRWSPVADL